MVSRDWRDINAKIADFIGKASMREAWMQQQLQPLFVEDASDLPYCCAFERASLAFCCCDALNKESRKNVKAACGAILISGYTFPSSVIGLNKIALALDDFLRCPLA